MKKIVFAFLLIISVHGFSQKTAIDFLITGREKMYKTNPADYSGAIANFNKSITKDANSPDAYQERGNAYSIVGEYNKAIMDFTTAISKYNEADDDELSKLYCSRGIQYYKINDFSNALNDFEKAQSYETYNGEIFRLKANIYMEKKSQKDAIANYKLALPFYQNGKDKILISEIFRNLAICEYQQKEYNQSYIHFNKAIEIDSNDILSYSYRGTLNYLKGLNFKALKDFNDILKIDSNNIYALYMRGYINYFYFDDRNIAKSDFNRVLSIDTNNNYSIFIHIINNNVNKFNESLDILNSKGKTVRASNYYYMARIYSLLFQESEAIAYLDSALNCGLEDLNEIKSIDPGFKNIRFKKSFKNLLTKHNISYESPVASIDLLNKIEYNELIVKESSQLSVEINFEESSGNNKLDGGEQAAVNVLIKNEGNGIAWCTDLVLYEKNNSNKISFNKTLSINKIMPHQTIEKKIEIKSLKNIKDTLDFFVDYNNNGNFNLRSNELEVITKPNIELSEAILLPVDSITSIDLSCKNLYKIPSEVFRLKNLEYINLSNNKIKSIDSLSLLKNLKYINLSNNEIGYLPNEICTLENLTTLLVGNNQLSDLPNYIQKLSNLRCLDIKNNQFKSFILPINGLVNLNELNISGNHINEIPDGINKLKELKILTLTNCNIQKCSPDLYKLDKLHVIYVDSNIFFSSENIITLRLNLLNTREIYFSEPNTNNRRLIDPIPAKDFSKIQEMWSKYLVGDYISMVKLGDYFDLQNQYLIAELIYNQAILSAKRESYSPYKELGDHFDDKGYTLVAEKAFQKTLEFPINNYIDRMNLAYDLYNRNFIGIANEHYSIITTEYNFNNDTIIYELAKFFEVDRGLYDLAIVLYEKISDNPENYGTGKDLLAKKTIIELCERHLDFSYSKSIFDLNKDICNSIPKDENALEIIKNGCKNCWEILDKTIAKKELLFEKKKKKAESLVQAAATTKKASAVAGIASSVVPGTAGSIASSTIQAGSVIANYAQDNAYERLLSEIKKLNEEIISLKQEQKTYVDNIPKSISKSSNNNNNLYSTSVTINDNTTLLNISTKIPLLIKYDSLDYFFIDEGQSADIPIVNRNRELIFYDFKNYRKQIKVLGENGIISTVSSLSFAYEINSQKSGIAYYSNIVKPNSYHKMIITQKNSKNTENSTPSIYTTVILNSTKNIYGKKYFETKSTYTDGMFFICSYDGLEYTNSIIIQLQTFYDIKEIKKDYNYCSPVGLPVGSTIHQNTNTLNGTYARNSNTTSTVTEKLRSLTINNRVYDDVVVIKYSEEGKSGNNNNMKPFKSTSIYYFAYGYGLIKGSSEYSSDGETAYTNTEMQFGDTICNPLIVEEGEFTDPRDNRLYKTVKIGNQVWMAENLHYKCKGSYDYKSNELSYIFGYLYTYKSMESACPAGWHIPTEKEWMVLIDMLGGKYVAGGHLKEAGSENWDENNVNVADNSSGFSARGGGSYSEVGILHNLNEYGKFWTAETSYLHILSGYSGILLDDHQQKNDKHSGNGFQYYDYLSIRCVKDDTIIEAK